MFCTVVSQDTRKCRFLGVFYAPFVQSTLRVRAEFGAPARNLCQQPAIKFHGADNARSLRASSLFSAHACSPALGSMKSPGASHEPSIVPREKKETKDPGRCYASRLSMVYSSGLEEERRRVGVLSCSVNCVALQFSRNFWRAGGWPVVGC